MVFLPLFSAIAFLFLSHFRFLLDPSFLSSLSLTSNCLCSFPTSHLLLINLRLFSFPFLIVLSFLYVYKHFSKLHTFSCFWSCLGTWLNQTASPYAGLMTQILWVTVSPTQPRKLKLRVRVHPGEAPQPSLSQPAPLPGSEDARSGPTAPGCLCLKLFLRALPAPWSGSKDTSF